MRANITETSITMATTIFNKLSNLERDILRIYIQAAMEECRSIIHDTRYHVQFQYDLYLILWELEHDPLPFYMRTSSSEQWWKEVSLKWKGSDSRIK
jgi:hypothetical protein